MRAAHRYDCRYFCDTRRWLQRVNAGHYPAKDSATSDQFRTLLFTLDTFDAGVIDRAPGLRYTADHLKQLSRDKWIEHWQNITRHGLNMPEIRNCKWGG